MKVFVKPIFKMKTKLNGRTTLQEVPVVRIMFRLCVALEQLARVMESRAETAGSLKGSSYR